MTQPPTSPPAHSRTSSLIARWQQDGDRRARDEVIEDFLPLARRLANLYANPYEPWEDLVQVASLGLISAINRFDVERGTEFPAFAIPTILGELKRHFRDTGWSAHVPRRAQELALRVSRAAGDLAAQTGRPPRVAELAQYLEISIESVLIGLDAANSHNAASLDAPVVGADPGDRLTLAETLGTRDDRFDLVDTILSLSAVSTRLPHRQRAALRLRLGGDMTQSEIAAQLGCSQMQVSRLLGRVRRTLRELTDPALR